MELLHRVRLRQVDIEDGKGRIVNLRPTADVEHPFFVVGRFRGLAYPDRRRGDGGDLHHMQTPKLMALRVRAQRVQAALGGWGDLHLDHLAPVGPVLVCEGVHTALALAVETHRE